MPVVLGHGKHDPGYCVLHMHGRVRLHAVLHACAASQRNIHSDMFPKLR
jgi:hypothetical protein